MKHQHQYSTPTHQVEHVITYCCFCMAAGRGIEWRRERAKHMRHFYSPTARYIYFFALNPMLMMNNQL